MEIKSSEKDGITVISLIGEMDTAAVKEINSQFYEFIGTPDKDYVIDCSQLSYIASAGLRLFLELRKAAKAVGRNVVIEGVTDLIMGVFKSTSFDKLFTIR